MPVVDELPLVGEIAPVILEQMQRFAVERLVSDRPVATEKVHVTFLTSAEVMEDPEVVPPVVIAPLLAPLASHDQNDWSFSWGEDPTLLLDTG